MKGTECATVSSSYSPLTKMSRAIDVETLRKLRAPKIEYTFYHKSETRKSDVTMTSKNKELFLQLADIWREATRYTSSTTEIVTHPAYQRIIGLGPAALPLILNELRREPEFWFWALRAITGEDPVSPESRGNLARMTEAWLQWASSRGLLPT